MYDILSEARKRVDIYYCVYYLYDPTNILPAVGWDM